MNEEALSHEYIVLVTDAADTLLFRVLALSPSIARKLVRICCREQGWGEYPDAAMRVVLVKSQSLVYLGRVPDEVRS